MRQISPKAITLFSALTIFNVIFNTTLCLFLNQIAGVAQQVLYFIMPISFYLTTILTYQLLFSYLKFPLHQIPKNSTEDFAFQLYVLYYLIYFNFFVHNTLLPVPIGSYSAGFILDPPYVKMGDNSIIGFGAVICSHALEGENVSFENITIGNNVTIGLRAMIMPGVRIEDNAIIAAGALVTKNTHIKAGEVWAGIPAKRIKLGQEEPIPSIANIAS
jgi:acetyltransferase-like isoleucine patch superfamily enzyme